MGSDSQLKPSQAVESRAREGEADHWADERFCPDSRTVVAGPRHEAADGSGCLSRRRRFVVEVSRGSGGRNGDSVEASEMANSEEREAETGEGLRLRRHVGQRYCRPRTLSPCWKIVVLHIS